MKITKETKITMSKEEVSNILKAHFKAEGIEVETIYFNIDLETDQFDRGPGIPYVSSIVLTGKC